MPKKSADLIKEFTDEHKAHLKDLEKLLLMRAYGILLLICNSVLVRVKFAKMAGNK